MQWAIAEKRRDKNTRTLTLAHRLYRQINVNGTQRVMSRLDEISEFSEKQNSAHTPANRIQLNAFTIYGATAFIYTQNHTQVI